ncbi:MAG TPA: hypothetical protein VN923_05880, partial [Thermoanaerobaculia bacterium]|nr:hypothetical protein [Thermoanaerobaculia bacterium]
SLDRLLGDLDHDRQEDRERDRGERIRHAGHVVQFETAKRDLLRPAVRDLMARLEQRGHAARLVDTKPTKLRVEVTLQAATPMRGIVDVELDEASGNVWFRARKQGTAMGERGVAVAELNESAIASALVEMLRSLNESVPAATTRPW